jgi:hypothetical protein
MGRIVGRVPFADGCEREVDENDEGRQYVLDDDAAKVYAVWRLPANEPVVEVRARDVTQRDGEVY